MNFPLFRCQLNQHKFGQTIVCGSSLYAIPNDSLVLNAINAIFSYIIQCTNHTVIIITYITKRLFDIVTMTNWLKIWQWWMYWWCNALTADMVILLFFALIFGDWFPFALSAFVQPISLFEFQKVRYLTSWNHWTFKKWDKYLTFWYRKVRYLTFWISHFLIEQLSILDKYQDKNQRCTSLFKL